MYPARLCADVARGLSPNMTFATTTPTTAPAPVTVNNRENDDPAQQVVLPQLDGDGNTELLYVLGPAVLTGRAVESASAAFDTNQGWLVLACYVSPEPELPGHIAIVRPAALSRRRIDSQGPQITQAGVKNYRSASLAEGFRHHPDAWRERAVKFYAHPVAP